VNDKHYNNNFCCIYNNYQVARYFLLLNHTVYSYNFIELGVSVSLLEYISLDDDDTSSICFTTLAGVELQSRLYYLFIYKRSFKINLETLFHIDCSIKVY